MFTTAILALLAASSAIAAPVTQEPRGKSTPTHYAEGYLESYDSYHTRYISIGCAGNQGTSFFDNCCRPLLASETVEANRPAYCAAGFAASSGSSSSAAAPASKAAESSAPIEAAVAVAQPSTTSKAVPTSSAAISSSAAPAPAPASSSAAAPPSTGGAQHTGGYATYFYQNGNPGACGNWNSDSDYGIAIDGNGFWQNYGQKSDHCGKKISLKNTRNGKSVIATVWDVCPTCVNDNSLDLSVGAFSAIADLSDGMVPIEWSWA